MGDRKPNAIPFAARPIFPPALYERPKFRLAKTVRSRQSIVIGRVRQEEAIGVETMRQALEAFCARSDTRGWTSLPFFKGDAGLEVAARVDAEMARGCEVLPPIPQVFNALVETPLEQVRVVILGQDPYPTPGDAHGLAFSYVGRGRVPASLRNILAEVTGDSGADFARTDFSRADLSRMADLTPWARSGVLLLNTALTTNAGQSGAHLKFGWDQLTNEIMDRVSRERHAVVFMLWGAAACARAEHVDRDKHLVLRCGHPSPLNRKQDFRGCNHFRRANEWLAAKGELPVVWQYIHTFAS